MRDVQGLAVNVRDSVDTVMTDVMEVRERTTILSDWVDVVTVIYLCTARPPKARLSKGREGVESAVQWCGIC